MVKNLQEVVESLKMDTTIPEGWEQSALDIANDAVDMLNRDGKFPFLRTVIEISYNSTRAMKRIIGDMDMWIDNLSMPRFYEPYWYDEDNVCLVRLNQNIRYDLYSRYGKQRESLRTICKWAGNIAGMPEGSYSEYLDFLIVNDNKANETNYQLYLDGYMKFSNFNKGFNDVKEDHGATQYIKFGHAGILNYAEILIAAMALIITKRYSGSAIDLGTDVPTQENPVPPSPVNISLQRRQQEYFNIINHYRNLADEREIEGAEWNEFPIETQIQDEFYTDRHIGYTEALDRRYNRFRS